MKRRTLEQQSDWISRRKTELGLSGHDYVSPNSGARRTASKKALLKKIEDGGQRTGRSWSTEARKK